MNSLPSSLPSHLSLFFDITGDFNIHVNNFSDPNTLQLTSILSDFNLSQLVSFPTHTSGNTLDLFIYQPCPFYSPAATCLPATPSDHFAILTTQRFRTSSAPTITRSFRRLKAINISDFNSDLSTSELILSPPSLLDDLITCYNSTLASLLDKHAPLISKKFNPSKSCPWFTPALKLLKRARRQLERNWLSLPSLANRTAFRRASNAYHTAIISAKKLYNRHLITENSSNPVNYGKL